MPGAGSLSETFSGTPVLALLKYIFSSSFDKGFGEFTALRILSSFLVFSHESREGPAVSVSLLVQSEL